MSINVIDVNDNAPKFFEKHPDLNSEENKLFCPPYNTTVCICFILFLELLRKSLLIFMSSLYTHFNLYCDLEMLDCKTVVFFVNVSDAGKLYGRYSRERVRLVRFIR